MIWALAREQARSQWRYAAAAAVVIAVTVAVAAYGMIMGLTLAHSQAQVDHLLGLDRDSLSDATNYPFGDLAAHIDAANADGHDVVGVATAFPMLPQSDGSNYDTGLMALYGDIDWSEILVEGAAPAPGQIAVNAEWATNNDVSLGDTVPFEVTSTDSNASASTRKFTLVVSGITRSTVGTAAVQLSVPSGFVAWDDIPMLNAELVSGGDGAQRDYFPAYVSGNGAWPWDSDLAANAIQMGGASSNPAASIMVISAIGVGALIVGLVAMAFALGRSQAQARTKWVGTVRALGASKRQVASATLLESGAVGVAAGIAGFLLGALAAGAHFVVIALRVANPMIVASPTGYLAVAVGAVALAVVLALIVGAVPAFWSARVAPTAALKPVTDIAEATVSRSVRTWPLTATWLVSLITFAAMLATDINGFEAGVAVFAGIVLVVTSIMVANEALRHSLPWQARRLSRSRHRAVMVAGDAILARPRQSTIPAFIVALASTVYLSLFSQLVVSWEIQREQEPFDPPVPNPYLAPLPALAVFAVVTLLCVAVAMASANVSSREAATREALGLTAAQGRLASALQYLTAQTHGLVLGLFGGVIGATLMIAMNNDSWLATLKTWSGAVYLLFLLVAIVAAACALVGASIAAAFTPRTAPLARVEVSA